MSDARVAAAGGAVPSGGADGTAIGMGRFTPWGTGGG